MFGLCCVPRGPWWLGAGGRGGGGRCGWKRTRHQRPGSGAGRGWLCRSGENSQGPVSLWTASPTKWPEPRVAAWSCRGKSPPLVAPSRGRSAGGLLINSGHWGSEAGLLRHPGCRRPPQGALSGLFIAGASPWLCSLQTRSYNGSGTHLRGNLSLAPLCRRLRGRQRCGAHGQAGASETFLAQGSPLQAPLPAENETPSLGFPQLVDNPFPTQEHQILGAAHSSVLLGCCPRGLAGPRCPPPPHLTFNAGRVPPQKWLCRGPTLRPVGKS